ncbi:hypothetical protein BMS3Abin03_01587 [bacterium BMS3Abin03]|nr:hypothetical protein BMS3Abin03_01587 [bacterium BMS3Abin03]
MRMAIRVITEYNATYSYDDDGYPLIRRVVSITNGISNTFNSVYEYE